jgi:putative SOS response-associated peptidase YedK
MCGRYVIVSTIHEIEKKFNVVSKERELAPNYNVAPGTIVPVVSSENKNELSFYQFGMTPSWAKKPMYLFNARSEGDSNKDNDMNYTGGMGIISKPSFRLPIRSQRCLIIADAFYEGPEKEKLSKPFLVYMREKKRPFAFAGIWDTWIDKSTGEEIKSCSIITSVSNSVTQAIGHRRSPIILFAKDYSKWLNTSRRLDEVTGLLEPYPGKLMNAYPVSDRMKSGRENNRELLDPVGDPVLKESKLEVRKTVKILGFGKTYKPGDKQK